MVSLDGLSIGLTLPRRPRAGYLKRMPGRRNAHGFVGLILIAVFWPLNWMLPGLRTAYLFFPLWLGYILAVDGLVLRRTGTSLWRRSRFRFVLLFFTSIPGWWLFEAINLRTRNWTYSGAEAFTDFEYFLLSSVAFSTVMPAVFETAELVRSFAFTRRFVSGPRIRPAAQLNAVLLGTGVVLLALTLILPRYFYPCVWISLVFILAPVNRWLGRRHLLSRLETGNWRPVFSLCLGALVCGWFWEMWNFYSYPRWTYHTPGAQFLHIFEMPLLGYGGYIPFALELYEMRNLLWPKSSGLGEEE